MTSAVDQFLSAQLAAGCEPHSLTVIRSGERLVEVGVAPWRLDGQALIYSMSKTFTSAAFGIAWDEGLLSPDDLVIELCPGLSDDDRIGPKARTITLADCLSMASGHDFDTISLSTAGRWAVTPDVIGDFLRSEPAGEPGVDFVYNQLCTYSVSAAITKATGLSTHAFLRDRLLDKLGFGPSYWPELDGVSLGFSGFHVSPRDLATFIGLLATGGIHQGERLLPEQWIARYRTRQVATPTVDASTDWAQGYGWQVWMGADGGHRADGACGQYGLIWPEQELAVVITSSTADMQVTIDQVREHLLPQLTSLTPAESATLPGPQGTAPEPGVVISAPITDAEGVSAGHLTLTSSDADWDLLYTDDMAVEHRLEVGFGEWRQGSLHWQVDGQARTARVACIGAVDGDLVRLQLACLQTPHSVLLEVGPESVAWSWTTAPLGPTRLVGLSLPDGWDSDPS